MFFPRFPTATSETNYPHDIHFRRMSAFKKMKTGSSEASSVEGTDDGGADDNALEQECKAFLHGFSIANIDLSRDKIQACSDPVFLDRCVKLCEGVDYIDIMEYKAIRACCISRLQALESGGTNDDALERKCRVFLEAIDSENLFDSIDTINAGSDP
jgi:hypothetical protein